MHFKDEVLDKLADVANIAQFVSFSPSLALRFSRIRHIEKGHRFDSPSSAVSALLASTEDRSVNVRSFKPETPQGAEFVYGLRSTCEVLEVLARLSKQGLYSIVNESIDLKDGGVSGVLHGDIIEFCPGETPRCVEGPNVASLPRDLGTKLLRVVYGFEPQLNYAREERVEFSLHPIRRGIADSHTIIWENEHVPAQPDRPLTRWPNNFSKMLGDKLFGLLLADLIGARVPRTRAITRKAGYFDFGRRTGCDSRWIRTCPAEPQPGKYSTSRRWVDPFEMISKEDPSGENLASLLIQDEVRPVYSGAALSGSSGKLIIEGVSGSGDRFMLGEQTQDVLPSTLFRRVTRLYRRLLSLFGEIRIEWVYDGSNVWIVQLQQEAAISSETWIVPGPETLQFTRFRVDDGIEVLRELIDSAVGTKTGILVDGRVGITSHVADLLRRNRVPSRFA